MKKSIKKVCALVMLTALLFTITVPKPVFATCPHPHPPKTRIASTSYYTSTTHTVNGKICTIYIYKIYKDAYCADCGTVFKTYFDGTMEKHSMSHY